MLFGADRPAWPRGFPPERIKEYERLPHLRSFDSMVSKSEGKVTVIQSLANRSPDVDALFRMLHGTHMDFETSLKIAAVHPFYPMPFNAQATLWREESFWALYLPLTVHGRVSDIWRSYVFQALSKCTQQLVALHEPVVEHLRGKHANLADFDSEIPLYEKTEALVQFVRTYRCPYSSLPSCVLDLYKELYSRDFIEENDIAGVHVWFKEISQFNIKFPSIQCYSQDQMEKLKSKTIWKPMNTTLLVVHINFEHLEGIPIHKAFMTHSFDHILYYAPGLAFDQCRSSVTSHLFCISDDRRGIFAYESMVHAMSTFPNFPNYLFLHDDAVIKERTIADVTSSKVPITANPESDPKGGGQLTTNWYPRNRTTDALINWDHLGFAFGGYERLANSTEWSKFQPQLEKRCQGFHYGQADEFFIPQRYRTNFIALASWMRRNTVYLETAIPTILHCAMESKQFKLHTEWDYFRGKEIMITNGCNEMLQLFIL